MAVHWQIPFKSPNETLYVVNIYDAGYNDDPVQLTGADNPFETQEDDSDDPFSPICYSTGYINVIVSDNAEIEGLLPIGTKDRFVELKSGTEILWQGYIKCEQFSGVWDTTPYTLSLPVISAVGSLQFLEFDGELETTTLCTLFGRCIAKTDANYSFAYLPADYTPADIKATIQTLAFYKQEFKQKYYVIGDDVPEPDMTITWYEVLEELCKYFGVQLHEYGRNIILSSKDSTTRYHRDDFTTFSRGTIGGNISTLPIINLPDIGDNNGNTSRSLPIQQVRISTPLTQIDRNIINVDQLKYLDWEDVISGEYKSKYYEGESLVDDEYVKTYMYSFHNGVSSPYIGIKRNLIYDVASEGPTPFNNFCNEDPDSMLLQGGCCAIDKMSRVGNKTPTITITGSQTTEFYQENPNGTYTTIDVGLPAVEITTRILYGNLNINSLQLWIELSSVEWDNTINDDKFQTLHFIISFLPYNGGNVLYYNPNKNAWEGNKAYVTYSTGNFVNEGIIMPVVNAIGRYRLTICTYPHKEYKVNQGGLVRETNPKFIRFKVLTFHALLSTTQANILERYDLESIERVKMTDAKSNEMYKQETMLFCNNELLNKYPDYKVPLTYCGIDAPRSLWENILDRMKAWYGIPRDSVEVTLQTAMLNAATHLHFQNDEYIIGAQNIKWRDDINRIKMYKL